MPNKLVAYTLLLASLAAGFISLLDWASFVEIVRVEWAGLATFVVLGVLSQALAVDSTVGAAKPVKSSIAFLPLLALAVVYPPTAVVVAAGGMVAANEVFVRPNRQWHRAFFNVSQSILSYGLGAWAFHAILEWAAGDYQFGSHIEFASVFFPFYVLAVAFFGLNLLFVGIWLAMREDLPVLDVFRETAGKGGGNLLYDLLASPVALIAAYLFINYGIPGLLGVVLPLLLIRHSYSVAIQLHKANRDLLQVLIKAIETRDPYTSGHSVRVATLARLIAEDYGLRGSTVADIENAALLHDIGKIDALYAEIISKESKLTAEEQDIIKTHATKGADLLRSLTSLDEEIIVGVRHHHERYDGSGYPDGLTGKNIPVAARIIMMCDSVDAMLSDRPYRSALPTSKVRHELERCSGTQFDPELVETVLRNNTIERAVQLVHRSGARAPVRAVAG